MSYKPLLANCRIPSNPRKTAPEENLENRDVSENDVLCHLCWNNVGKTIHILQRVRQSGMRLQIATTQEESFRMTLFWTADVPKLDALYLEEQQIAIRFAQVAYTIRRQ